METMLPVSSRPLQYYVLAKRWTSDLEFFRLETGFLLKLLDRYMSRLQDQGHIQQLIKAGKEIRDLQQSEIEALLSAQITQLELMAEDIIPEDADALAAVQVKLENLMTNLTQKFRVVKKDVYRLVLDVLHTNQTHIKDY